MDVFLSFSFRDEDRELVDHLETLVTSHDVRPVTGRVLDGEPLTSAIMDKIGESYALVAVMTRRDALSEGGWRTHPWVRDELNHARSLQLPAIALVETGVAVEGAYTEHERIELDTADPLRALLELSKRLGNWKRDRGRTLLAKVLPADIGHQIAGDRSWRCVYRFWTGGRPDDWREGVLVPAEGGTEIHIHGVRDSDAMVQVELRRNGQTTWRSPATPQRLTIQLSNGVGS